MKRKHKQKIYITFAVTILILLAVYFGIAYFYQSHFFIGTSINGINASNQGVDAVEDSIRREVKNYVLKIDGRNKLTDVITADSIDYKYVSDGAVKELLNKQNPYAWIVSLFKKSANDMHVTTSFDEQKLADKIDSLVFFEKDNIKSPVDASVNYNDTAGQYEIIPEDNGSALDKDIFQKTLMKMIESGDTYYNLDEQKCYLNPKYTSSSTKLKSLLETLNQYVNVTVTYEFGDRYEICDKTYIQDWLEVDDNFKVSFNLEKVRSYIDSVARIYNTFGKTRDFKNHDGKLIEVSGGDYGWLIDRPTETTRLIELIKAGKNVQVEPNYSQKARSREKNDIGSSYVEIDLTKQHVWAYKDGKLVIDSDCVTGNSSKGHDTPSGIYQITYKERNATLNGENYSSDVKYWMPFYYNVGLHDAPWRHGRFGGTIYKTSGSHGCVNLPPNVAETIFANVEKGTPIVVYSSKPEDKTTSGSETKKTKEKTSTSSKPENTSNTATGNN